MMFSLSGRPLHGEVIHPHRGGATWFYLVSSLLFVGPAWAERVEFAEAFAPAEGWVRPVERPHRQEICLNGRWQFQPVPVPAQGRREQGQPPVLPMPAPGAWEPTPIKIPSPWNVNTWGAGRDVGAGTDHPYWPSSEYFPSYPEAWDRADMGWLRRSFDLPEGWHDRRIVLHFEAVAGACQVWVNEQPAGRHFDKYLPFELDVTDLVRFDRPNELLVGVRAHALFNRRSERYPRMQTPYPCGSQTASLAGIWQDVFLLALPAVRVEEVFIKPLLDRDLLEVEVTLRNDTDAEQAVAVAGTVHPWINLAGADVLSAPVPRWRLDPPMLDLPEHAASLPPGASRTLVLRERVNQRLAAWAPGTPNLYAAVLRVMQGERVVDRRLERFGWRQFSIEGSDVLLNGRKIQLVGDFLHPFGPYTMSRRFVWAWYRMIQDFGGNAVRPHAQVHPRCYLDLADEMGLVVLDESAIFGSSIVLNVEAPEAWDRFAEHVDGLVLRDRNHPSVLGWSFGNELFAVFDLNNVSGDDAGRWYRQLAELGQRAARLDPTRPWISCDGDEDLRGALPVWSKHFGHGTPLAAVPDLGKPLMVGESGGTYYARPRQLAEFNGDRAYQSYAGRNEALAIDVYDNIVRLALPRLAYFSASETAWFGVEHLNFGYRDFSRLPGAQDGVFFSRPFTEGAPGMQPERLPPYVSTLNPGWDPDLPLYRPLAMFHAQKAALDRNGPQPCAWDRQVAPPEPRPPAADPSIDHVRFIGVPGGLLSRRLKRWGVPLGGKGTAFTVLEGANMEGALLEEARALLDEIEAEGGVLMILVGAGPASVDLSGLASLLPGPIQLTDRLTTALEYDAGHPVTASFTRPDLYFAEDGADRYILRHGLAGPLVDRGRVLLRASGTDWSLFNNVPEFAKCAAVVLHEALQKPSGAALVEYPHGQGTLLICSITYAPSAKPVQAFWRRLFNNLGVRLLDVGGEAIEAFDTEGVLVNALSAGRFSAMAAAPPGLATSRPARNAAAGERTWQAVTSPSHDRFLFRELDQQGADERFSVYFSYWVKSPRALDDLLADGPDAPRVTSFCYVADTCRLWLNGDERDPTAVESADYRLRYRYEGLPLKRGWNHFLVEVASGRLDGNEPGTLAVRMTCSQPEFLRQMESAIERPTEH